MKNKIITLTLNPSIDYILSVDSLLLYNKNIIRDQHTYYGGKGINVAFALGKLSASCTAAGFISEKDQAALDLKLSGVGIRPAFVPVAGSTRSTYKVMDMQQQKDTEFNQAGFSINTEDLDRLQGVLDSLFGNADWLAISGSQPPGVEPEYYRDLIMAANRQGLKTCLDASGKALRSGVTGKPSLLRVNRSELGEAVGRELQDLGQVRAAANQLIASGIEMVVVSMGGQGVLATDGQTAYQAAVPQVAVASLTGAGDTLTAGFLHAITKGDSFPDALQFGSALATASTLKLEPGDFDPADHAEILKQTVVKQLS